jgi:hypothetical protein
MVSPLRFDDCFIHGCLYISEVREIQERQKKIPAPDESGTGI